MILQMKTKNQQLFTQYHNTRISRIKSFSTHSESGGHPVMYKTENLFLPYYDKKKASKNHPLSYISLSLARVIYHMPSLLSFFLLPLIIYM